MPGVGEAEGARAFGDVREVAEGVAPDQRQGDHAEGREAEHQRSREALAPGPDEPEREQGEALRDDAEGDDPDGFPAGDMHGVAVLDAAHREAEDEAEAPQRGGEDDEGDEVGRADGPTGGGAGHAAMLGRAGAAAPSDRGRARSRPGEWRTQRVLVSEDDELDAVAGVELGQQAPDVGLDGGPAMNSFAPISALVAPRARAWRTARSRSVRASSRGSCLVAPGSSTWSSRRRVALGATTASPLWIARIAASSSSGSASLSRKPEAPARRAENTYSSRSKVVRTSDPSGGRSARWRRRRRVAACARPSGRRRRS